MADAPSPSTEAAQPNLASSEGAGGLPGAGPDAVASLAAELRALQTRYDELLRRFLDQVEQRQALDKALYAERVKTAALRRDLGVFQRQWQIARKEWHVTQDRWRNAQASANAALLEAQAQRDQLRQLSERLQRELHAMRHSRVWQLGQLYWKTARKVQRR